MKLGFGFGRITRAEYDANLNGLKMFFGAMLGLVMAGTERMNNWVFAYTLMMIAGVVVCILYVTASRHRLGYAALALGMSVLVPVVVDAFLRKRGAALPDKVQPTLIVWAVMTILIEWYPRERDASADE